MAKAGWDNVGVTGEYDGLVGLPEDSCWSLLSWVEGGA